MKIKTLRHITVLLVLSFLAVGCNENTDLDLNDTNIDQCFTVKTVSLNSKYESFKFVKGVVADGSILKIKILKLSDYDLSNVEMKIEQENSGGLSLTPEAKPVTLLSDPTPTPKTYENTKYYEYYYHAPVDFPSTSDGNDSILVIKVDIRITVNGKQFMLTRPVELIRTPIVLAHGLASDSTTFNPMIDYIMETKQYLRTAIYPLDYSESSMDAYAMNDKVIENAIDVVRERVYASGYEVSKVNIAGHSMGGILTRLYLQSGRYRGDIQQFVSIDTPHSGSQGADLLVELGEKHPGTILETIGKLGAIVDLQVDSKATLEELNGGGLNLVKVPSAAIKATFAGTKQVAQLVKEKQFLQAALVLVLGHFTENVYGEENDIVVPLSSQQGGLKERSTISFDGEWHCSVHTTRESAEKLVAMFNHRIARGFEFTTDGFAPPKLVYRSILNSVNVQNVVQNGASKDTFVLPEAVSEAVIFAVGEDGKIIDAKHFDTGELKYTGKLQDAKVLKLLARTNKEGDFICSEIAL